MEWTYTCPHCDGHLNPAQEKIILFAESLRGKGMFLFDARPGDYSLDLPKNLTVNPEELWDFSCPVCRHSLQSKLDEKLAMIHLTTDEQSLHKVYFSRIAGEQCTFVVNAEGIQTYGPHQRIYEGLAFTRFI